MIEVFLYTCNCGITGALIRKVSRFAQRNFLDFTIYHTKYDVDMLFKHAKLLNQNNLPVDGYRTIVVYNGEVKELKNWTD